MLALLLLALAPGVEGGCPNQSIRPLGGQSAVRFFAVPPARAVEAAADAMQAAGFALFKQTDLRLEGDRTKELITALGLPEGDEAVSVWIEPDTESGVAGTRIRVETFRNGMKKGKPKYYWSEPVLSGTACLLELLSVEDPARRATASAAEPPAIPDGTKVDVRLRRFLQSAKVKPGRPVYFETADNVTVDGKVVIPRGSLVVARAHLDRDIGEFGKAAKGGIRFESLILPGGAKVPLRGAADLEGRKKNATALGALAVGVSWGFAGISGTGFVIPAGTLMSAEVGPPLKP